METCVSVLHWQVGDLNTGRPDQMPEAVARFLQRIKQQTGAAINITSGGSPYTNFRPEVTSLRGAFGTEDGAPK